MKCEHLGTVQYWGISQGYQCSKCYSCFETLEDAKTDSKDKRNTNILVNKLKEVIN